MTESTIFSKDRTATFLEGQAGLHALSADISYRLGNIEAMTTSMSLLKNLSTKVSQLPQEDCELLYGRAGYLFAVAYCRAATRQTDFARSTVRLVIADILRQGLAAAASPDLPSKLPLAFGWHRSVYLGAAHGYAGILLTLLYFPNELNEAERLSGMPTGHALRLIEDCINIVFANYSFTSGNVQSSVESRNDKLVHWCHGAPGWVLLIAKCCEVFGCKYYKKMLLELGEVVWNRGLLRKGLGLCHGIGGNGLALLTVFRATKDNLWLERAKKFAVFGIQHIDDLLMIPDRPFSLYEGLAGFTVFLNELQQPEKSCFPGGEVC
eukprot:CAMPEP_0113846224 /NCGR_PEP_ID=MMETSP0372-20130328/1191_1 /TAXON_ID=340204 /ORGANISM="Lankesteria abbotti" /LENGTH=322 /DNA_ID=CAMNT_0000815349 /DNA_START=209 /DNA_END=1177 /DNA_ORIENTATION=+ /assembly_acc=CAM_ASM_000359